MGKHLLVIEIADFINEKGPFSTSRMSNTLLHNIGGEFVL
jgi:hypothetical protein